MIATDRSGDGYRRITAPPAIAVLAAFVLLLVGPVAPAAAAPSWLAPTVLFEGSPAPGEDQVAVGPDGEAVAVFLGADGGGYALKAASRPPGGNWSAPTDLTEAGQGSSSPAVAIGPDGTAIAVWAEQDGGVSTIRAASHSPGGTWSAASDLSVVGQEAFASEIAIGPGGEARAVWEQVAGGHEEGVWSSSRPAGGTWSTPTELSAAGREGNDPQITIGSAGDAVAVWEELDGGHDVIQASSPGPGGWSTPTQVSEPGEDSFAPEVAVGPEGDAVVVWQQDAGMVPHVKASSRPRGGGWSTPTELSETGEEGYSAEIALGPAGEAVAVWTRVDGTHQVIQAATRALGGSWTSPANLSPIGGEDSEPRVVIGADGKAIAIWQEFGEGTDDSVQVSSHVPGGTWLAGERIGGGAWADRTEIGRRDIGPRLAVDAAGDAVAVWQQEDAAGFGVEAAGFDAAGPLLPSLSIPPAAVVGQTVPFSVTPLDVWSALGQTDWSFGDGTTATGTSVDHVYSRLGTYTVSVTSADALGNTSTALGTVVVTPAPVTTPAAGILATVPPAAHHPSVRITHRPGQGRGGRKGKGGPRYAFRFYDETPGATYLCSLDGTPFSPCGSPQVYGRLKPALHVFRVKSVDSAGVESAIRTVKFLAGKRHRGDAK